MFNFNRTALTSNIRRRSASHRAALLERLESRQLLSVTQPNFTNFSTTSGLTANGYGGQPLTAGNALVLTDGLNGESHSVFWTQAVPIDKFTTHFAYTSDANSNTADGFTFTIQGNDPSSLGGNGANLGYGSIIKSAAVAFNLYNGGSFGTNFGFASAGVLPPTNTNATPVDLHNGDTYNGTVTYDGTTLSVTLVDASDSSKTFSASEAVNLPTLVGGDNAFVGFTAATGNNVSNQRLESWTYAGTNAPTVATPAQASVSPITGKTVGLSVLGADKGGESNLTYTWSLIKSPTGARAPTYTANGSNAAKATTAHFYKDGSYTFRATITNSSGGFTVSDVTVVVDQKATELRLTPHAQHLTTKQHITFKATVIDQFHHALRTAPTITYAVETGGGTIGASSGAYVAGKTAGHVEILATDTTDNLSGVAGATVLG